MVKIKIWGHLFLKIGSKLDQVNYMPISFPPLGYKATEKIQYTQANCETETMHSTFLYLSLFNDKPFQSFKGVVYNDIIFLIHLGKKFSISVSLTIISF